MHYGAAAGPLAGLTQASISRVKQESEFRERVWVRKGPEDALMPRCSDFPFLNCAI